MTIVGVVLGCFTLVACGRSGAGPFPVPRAVRDGGRVVTLRGFDGPGERGVAFEPIIVFRYAREWSR